MGWRFSILDYDKFSVVAFGRWPTGLYVGLDAPMGLQNSLATKAKQNSVPRQLGYPSTC